MDNCPIRNKLASSHHNKRLSPSKPKSRHGSVFLTLLFLIALFTAAGYGGYRYWQAKTVATQDDNIILHTVARDDFLMAVTERGEVESAKATEVRSEVKSTNSGGLSILRVVSEGTHVEEGDFLVQLDASAFEEERITQQISVNTAEALMIESQNLYETALIAKEEYEKGTFVQEQQTLESEMFVAEENFNRAKEYYAYSKKLAAKGYVNQLQLEADKFAVEKTVKEQQAAKTKLRVLEEFTKRKMIRQLQTDIKVHHARWEGGKNSYELALSKLREIEDRIAKCTITAPKEGTVVYAHKNDRRGQDDFIVEEGAMIRERQAIITFPDADSMRVKVLINEAFISFVKPGLQATVTPVGLDRVLQGEVESVNQYAEPSGWRKANVKEYKAHVKITENVPELRSGMTAAVMIRCKYVPDALQVPVQSVYAHGDRYYCFVYKNGDFEARPVVCGSTNDSFFVVEEGLAEAERVSMNPRKFLRRVTLPELDQEDKQRVVKRAPVTPTDKPGA